MQQFSTPFLDGLFKAITIIGNGEYYVLVIPLFFWLYDKKFALRLGGFVLASAWLNEAAKGVFRAPRPPDQFHKIIQGGYSFPSGHAQGSASFWGYLAVQRRRPGAYVIAAAAVALVSLSRLYLGVHFPIDVLAGVVIGIGWLAVFEFCRRRGPVIINRWQWYLASLLLAGLVLVTGRNAASLRLAGFLLSSLWGYRLEADYVKFPVKGGWRQNLVKAVLGLAALIAIYSANPVIMNALGQPKPGDVLYAVGLFSRYFLMGFWVSFLAPLSFKTLGLHPSPRQS